MKDRISELELTNKINEAIKKYKCIVDGINKIPSSDNDQNWSATIKPDNIVSSFLETALRESQDFIKKYNVDWPEDE